MAHTIDSGTRLRDALENNAALEKGYIQALSEGILRAFPSITGVSTAPSAIVKYHFPENGNESIIGHDLLSNPERRDSLTRAAELKTAVVSGPFESVDGGNFLFVRYPVFAHDKLWGFVSLTIDFSKMLQSFGLESHYPGIRFALSGNSDGASGGEAEQAPISRFLGGNAAAWDKGGVSQKISLPGAEWRVHVMPSRNWTLVDPYLYILFGAGLTASAVLFFVFYSRVRRKKVEPEDKGNWLEESVKAARYKVSIPTPIPSDFGPIDAGAGRTQKTEIVQPSEEIGASHPVAETGTEGTESPAPAGEPPRSIDQEPAMGSLFPGLAIIAKNGGRELRFKGPAVKGELYMPEASASAKKPSLMENPVSEEQPLPATSTPSAPLAAHPAAQPAAGKPHTAPAVATLPNPKQEFLFSLEEEPSHGDCAILVVDDSDANRDIMGRMLSLRGYNADFAGSGEEAISLCEHRQYNIIFMDCFMPGMDGYKTCAALREKAPDSGAKIIAMSARIGEQELQRCREAGMDELLAKPFTMKQMLAHLDKPSPDGRGLSRQE